MSSKDPLEKCVIDLQSLLISAANGLTEKELLDDYHNINGRPLPFQALEVDNEAAVLRELVKCRKLRYSAQTKRYVASKATAQGAEHLVDLVKRQNNKSGKTSKLSNTNAPSRVPSYRGGHSAFRGRGGGGHRGGYTSHNNVTTRSSNTHYSSSARHQQAPVAPRFSSRQTQQQVSRHQVPENPVPPRLSANQPQYQAQSTNGPFLVGNGNDQQSQLQHKSKQQQYDIPKQHPTAVDHHPNDVEKQERTVGFQNRTAADLFGHQQDHQFHWKLADMENLTPLLTVTVPNSHEPVVSIEPSSSGPTTTSSSSADVRHVVRGSGKRKLRGNLRHKNTVPLARESSAAMSEFSATSFEVPPTPVFVVPPPPGFENCVPKITEDEEKVQVERDCVALVNDFPDGIPYSELNTCFQTKYHRHLNLERFGRHSNVANLIGMFPSTFTFRSMKLVLQSSPIPDTYSPPPDMTKSVGNSDDATLSPVASRNMIDILLAHLLTTDDRWAKPIPSVVLPLSDLLQQLNLSSEFSQQELLEFVEKETQDFASLLVLDTLYDQTAVRLKSLGELLRDLEAFVRVQPSQPLLLDVKDVVSDLWTCVDEAVGSGLKTDILNCGCFHFDDDAEDLILSATDENKAIPVPNLPSGETGAEEDAWIEMEVVQIPGSGMDNFFIRSIDLAPDYPYARMEHEMWDFYQNPRVNEYPEFEIYNPQAGTYCAVNVPEANLWVRGKILHQHKDGYYVEFVDSGDTEVVNPGRCKILLNYFRELDVRVLQSCIDFTLTDSHRVLEQVNSVFREFLAYYGSTMWVYPRKLETKDGGVVVSLSDMCHKKEGEEVFFTDVVSQQYRLYHNTVLADAVKMQEEGGQAKWKEDFEKELGSSDEEFLA